MSNYKSLEAEFKKFLQSSGLNDLSDETQDEFSKTKQIITSLVDDYFNIAKQKSVDLGDSIVHYATKNPLKLAGFSTAVGFLVGLLFKNK